MINDLPALGLLAVDAVLGMTDLVEAVHSRVAGVPPAARLGGITGLVYNNVRGVTHLVGAVNRLLARLTPVSDEPCPTPQRAAMVAALNGVLGDYLEATHNPLATPMALCYAGCALDLAAPGLAQAIPAPGNKLLVLVHGLCMNPQQWSSAGSDFGAALARDFGYTPIHLHYNTGLHISSNGLRFAQMLEALAAHWPVPLDEITILAHSMGGLVARSALLHAAALTWPARLRNLIFLGTPHHGSPLERGGLRLQKALEINSYTAPFARLGKIRSAGITDMRNGSLADEDWRDIDRFARSHHLPRHTPLPEGVRCFAAAAVLKTPPHSRAASLLGDGLVPLASALGRHADPARTLNFPEAHRYIAAPLSHLGLLSHPAVYDRIHHWLST